MKKLMVLLAFVAGCATLPARTTAKSKCLCSPACCGETCKCSVKGECQPAAPGNCGGSCTR
ncbi:MAG: hypothetical protein NTY10_05925 [Candidatus Omnitrophica bacterium]|nr:hypothetical protein [Candidatus Omnitrophota bacterium]